MANKKKGLADSMDSVYFFDMEVNVDSAKAKPSHNYEDFSNEVSAKVLPKAEHLERRFSRKDLNLRGNGRITNKMLMIQFKTKDKRSGRDHVFYKNLGALEGRNKFNPSKNLTLLDNNLDDLYLEMDNEGESEYEDGNKTAIFGGGFTVQKILLRTVVKSKPTRVNQARLIMGARNLKVTKMD